MNTQKIKSHIQTHKVKYAFAAGITVGVLVSPKVIQVAYKSPNAAQIAQLTRRMHPGLVIRNKETGEVAASMRRMAAIDGLSYSALYKMVKGGVGPYEILGEASQ